MIGHIRSCMGMVLMPDFVLADVILIVRCLRLTSRAFRLINSDARIPVYKRMRGISCSGDSNRHKRLIACVVNGL